MILFNFVWQRSLKIFRSNFFTTLTHGFAAPAIAPASPEYCPGSHTSSVAIILLFISPPIAWPSPAIPHRSSPSPRCPARNTAAVPFGSPPVHTPSSLRTASGRKRSTQPHRPAVHRSRSAVQNPFRIHPGTSWATACKGRWPCHLPSRSISSL